MSKDKKKRPRKDFGVVPGKGVVEHIDGDEFATVDINIAFPRWMLEIVDEEARRLAIPREAVIKTWLSDRIKIEPTDDFDY